MHSAWPTREATLDLRAAGRWARITYCTRNVVGHALFVSLSAQDVLDGLKVAMNILHELHSYFDSLHGRN
jgi:hypothetical protein